MRSPVTPCTFRTRRETGGSLAPGKQEPKLLSRRGAIWTNTGHLDDLSVWCMNVPDTRRCAPATYPVGLKMETVGNPLLQVQKDIHHPGRWPSEIKKRAI